MSSAIFVQAVHGVVSATISGNVIRNIAAVSSPAAISGGPDPDAASATVSGNVYADGTSLHVITSDGLSATCTGNTDYATGAAANC